MAVACGKLVEKPGYGSQRKCLKTFQDDVNI
jgi:hypothetical protein